MRCITSFRSGCRLGYVHFWATSLRCQRKIVSGVTIYDELVEDLSAQRDAAHRESEAAIVGQPKLPLCDLRLQVAILLAGVLEDALLVPVEPPGANEGEDVE